MHDNQGLASCVCRVENGVAVLNLIQCRNDNVRERAMQVPTGFCDFAQNDVCHHGFDQRSPESTLVIEEIYFFKIAKVHFVSTDKVVVVENNHLDL